MRESRAAADKLGREREERIGSGVVFGRKRRAVGAGVRCSRTRAVKEEGSRAPWKRKSQRCGGDQDTEGGPAPAATLLCLGFIREGFAWKCRR